MRGFGATFIAWAFAAFATGQVEAFSTPTNNAQWMLSNGLNDVARPKASGMVNPVYQPSTKGRRVMTTKMHATPAAVTACATAAAANPSLKVVALVCLIPSLLGYYKSEYGVSYAYGTATASVAYLVLQTLSPTSVLPVPSTIAALHAAAVFFYGLRLNAFLLYRELFVPRFRKMRERIEDRARSRGNRINRTPFILFCAFLYGCMTSPILVTQKLLAGAPLYSPGDGWAKISVLVACCVTWFGFLLGAMGDLTKSFVKARKGDDHLVTGGVYRFFRHPNYTGEVIGWTANSATAFFAVLAAGANSSMWKKYAPYLVASVLGSTLISFVLGAATANLESRQKEQYGKTQTYKDWVKSSWVGFKLGKDKNNESTDENDTASEVPDFEQKEDSGSGI